jgi:hypothetical protein
MRGLRRHLSAVFGTWLLCHACAFALTPISLCAAMSAAAPAPECTCDHGAATECPMHPHSTTKSKAPCSCRSASDDTVMAIAAWLGPIAVPASDAGLHAPDDGASDVAPLRASLLTAPTTPASPPPRA